MNDAGRLGAGRPRVPDAGPRPAARVCLQCGIEAGAGGGGFCRRCGLPYGSPPRPFMEPSCPICYLKADADGRFDSPGGERRRLDLVAHMALHDQWPVGDDDYLDGLREGDLVRIGRWTAPYQLVRRYLVLGVVDAGRSRQLLHNALLTAMGQLARWHGPPPDGDTREWAQARLALSTVMERYHRRTRLGG